MAKIRNRIIKNIAFEPEVFDAIEDLRGNIPHFRSGFINKILKKELGLEKGAVKK